MKRLVNDFVEEIRALAIFEQQEACPSLCLLPIDMQEVMLKTFANGAAWGASETIRRLRTEGMKELGLL